MRFLLVVAGWGLLARAGVGTPARPADEARNVLVLFSYDAQSTSHYSAELSEALGHSPFPVQMFDEYLDLARFPDAHREQLLADSLREKYAGLKFDAVLCYGSPALGFWRHKGELLAPGAPVLLAAVNQRRIDNLKLPPSYLGTDFSFNDSALLQWAKSLQPDLKNVFFLAGATPYEIYWASRRAAGVQSDNPGIHCVVLPTDSMANLQNRVSTLPPHSALIFYSMTRDGAGRFFTPEAAVKLLSQSANAPIYTNFLSLIGHGALGGRIVDYEIGKWLRALLLRILSGEVPARIGFPMHHADVFVADWRELNRWHIDLAHVPAHTIILNRQYTMWEIYGGRILAASVALALEASLILVLMLELRRRRRVESRMKELSGKLLTAQEEERSRIARELHDDLGQQLAMLGFGVAALQREADMSPDKVSESANTLEEQLGRLAGSLRQLSHDLHPSMLDYAGLPAALRSHAMEFGEACGLRITVEADEKASELSPQIALPLFRITQEALRNVTKHARATEVKIILTLTPKSVNLAITDNGRGFRPHTTRGLGLQSIDERSRLLGGTVVIKSFPERGATVRLSIPLSGERPQLGNFTDRDPPDRHGAGFSTNIGADRGA